MKMKLFWLIIVFYVSVEMVPAKPTPSTTTIAAMRSLPEINVEEFIEQVENLVLSTTKEALHVTTHVYRNLTKSMPPLLQHAIVPITTRYILMIEKYLKLPQNYSEQRKLLHHFRGYNMQIERLRQQLQPQYPKFEFHLISHDFYYGGKNTTEFDNLYLKFMLAFQRLSKMLRDSMSEDVAEQQQDLLDILDEISKEKELSERDKLYDEFIEMFLFKVEIGSVESRQLE